MTDLKRNLPTRKTSNSIESPQAGRDNHCVRNKICKYFNTKKGCTRGICCNETKDKDRDDCKFWMRGKCKFSDDICWNKYDHSKEGTKERKSFTNKNAKES